MKDHILEKIARELSLDNPDECRFVYVLSRIRKYLEVANAQEKYKYMNFYCNWALHTRIDKTKAMDEVLHDFMRKDDPHGFTQGAPFFKDFEAFLEEHSLPRIWVSPSNKMELIRLMLEIYSDTPIYFYPDPPKKFKLTINKPNIVTGRLPEGYEYLMEYDIRPVE